jgi:hypothetical protein
MKYIDFTQAGGYRFKQPTLKKMQESYFEVLKAFVRHLGMPDVGNFIISGCEVVGANITEGMLYIDGELCAFAQTAGTADTLIKKNIEFTYLPFKTGASLPVFRSTNAIVVDADGVALSAFTRIQTVKNLTWDNIGEKPVGIVIDPNFEVPETLTLVERITALEARPIANVPIGLVAIWGLPENEIPAGWVAHEPLAGRMPIGRTDGDAQFDSTTGVGATGGAKNKTLSILEMPTHNHDFSADTNIAYGTGDGVTRKRTGIEVTGTGEAVSGTIANKGGGQEFSIMNPYRVVDFIRYVGV